ncbi:GNAT family N-acetyltransferase [Mangrovimicrobium sediminis]|uniref:GNAT family N-acetyltransferase n=1 Tax=Mangrovimicrobium sediminis TaxID=2562682 RepID=A0A4Z0M4M0_9GAMM|nr:GNAT family N-acetyltransferase [Haliea sp. SAOS-164]TGD74318.1 GNAT family N-acetyltransferase [Haliea sp. SAOS-164]
MNIDYRVNAPVSAAQFVAVLRASTLAQRRPVDDLACIQGMLDHANLTVSAWEGEELVGIARSVTDFHYACYLSDLAVDARCQGRGIGRRLQALTQEQLGPHGKLILIAAPAANTYYAQLGMQNNPRCWVLERDARLPQ